MSDNRTGGQAVVDALAAASCDCVFGVPGFQALALWDALADADIRSVGMRTELSAAFAADGYARAGRRPGVMLTTTGPGAVIGAAGLIEARMSYVPVVNLATQIPSALLGHRRGAIHELADQSTILAASSKWHCLVRNPADIPPTIAEAFTQAVTAPYGPVVVEIPCDLLGKRMEFPVPDSSESEVVHPEPNPRILAEVARLLSASRRPALLAGGGVLRSGAASSFIALAEQLDAPAVTTFMGKGSIPADHYLSVGSACNEPAVIELLQSSDVVLAVGTELGEQTTNQWSLIFKGTLIHIDVRADHLGRNYPESLGIVGDARDVLERLSEKVSNRPRGGEKRAQAVRNILSSVLVARTDEIEFRILQTVRDILARDAIAVWDMTMSGYVAAPHYPVYEPDTWLYPLGSGTLGYAWPAAIGAKLAQPDADVLAIHGDGGVLYGLLELLTATQHRIAAKLLIVDDGGYEVLRVIQNREYGRTFGVDLNQPNFPAMIRSLGVPLFSASISTLRTSLRAALDEDGPAVVYLDTATRIQA